MKISSSADIDFFFSSLTTGHRSLVVAAQQPAPATNELTN